MLNEILKRRVLIVLGKGGAGRTTGAATLGLLAARRGRRVLLIESDPHAPLSSRFGRPPSYAPAEIEPGLFLMAMSGPRALEEYLSITVPSPRMLRAVLSSRLYEYFVQAAPGLRELVMIGKLYHEIERRPADLPAWDLVVFDAPASGQALSLLRMPCTADEIFGGSLVGREARNVAEFLRHSERCAVLQVAIAEPLAVSETIETHIALSKIGIRPVAVILNRIVTLPFGAREVASMISRAAEKQRLREVTRYARIARGCLRSQSRAREALSHLQRQTGTPVIEAPELYAREGLELIHGLAEWLGRIAGRQERHVAASDRKH